MAMLAQNTVSGNVTDMATKQSLSGVNINAGSKSTSTGIDGSYQLSNVSVGDKITFTYVGYKTKEVIYDGQKTLNISIAEDTNALKEVVVQIGYGGVKKKDATGSVSVLTSKDFNKGATVTAENLLNGRIAGVTINTSGAPGSSSEIRIRGGASLFASNDPLIVIDGLPIENNSDKNYGSTSILASLNPSTIESMTVLKDASATAIYGSRASNGVIIITTKKGSKTLAVEYNVQYGSGNITKTVDVFSADEFRKIVADNRPELVSKLGNANTDWQKAIYRHTESIDNNLSIRGNLFGAIPTRLSLGNTNQKGLRLTNTFNRNTISLAMNPSFLQDHLKLKLTANYANERNRFAESVENNAIQFDPTQPISDGGAAYQGYFEYHKPVNSLGQYVLSTNVPRNPVAQLLQTMDTGKNNRFFGNFEMDYKFHFLPALRAVVNVGFDEAKGERSKSAASGSVASTGSNDNIPYGTNEFSTSNRKNKLLDAYLAYNKTFGKLVFDMTGGYSYQKFETRRFETGNTSNPNLLLGPTGFPLLTLDTDVVLIGFFARTNFNFNDKYLLTLSYRRDGSSRFDSDNRWGNFPAAAFAWKMKEDFFKESNTVSDLKLRLGYGISGNQNINDASNSYLQKYITGQGTSQYFFGTSATPIAITDRLSPNLKWEQTTTYNAGLDYGLFKNRITGSVDVFYKKTTDLLVDAPVADGSNFSNRAYQNVGGFTTKGVEFAINAEIVKGEKFNWNANFNVSTYKRKIESLIYNADISVGDNIAGTGTQAQLHREGFSPNSYLLFKQLYDVAGKPIEGAYEDSNNDGIVNEKDKYIYRNPDPKATFGFASNMTYRNIDFSFNLRASVGNHVFNAVNAKYAQFDRLNTGNAAGNIPRSVLDTGFNTTSKVLLSDLYVENASYLKVDNITLGYTFPKWLEGKASLRFYTGVQNAFVYTKYSGLDPEVANNGVDNTIYPRQRTFLFGANVKF
jgi:TonB-dependent starch-binding outer membrane protein SusC